MYRYHHATTTTAIRNYHCHQLPPPTPPAIPSPPHSPHMPASPHGPHKHHRHHHRLDLHHHDHHQPPGTNNTTAAATTTTTTTTATTATATHHSCHGLAGRILPRAMSTGLALTCLMQQVRQSPAGPLKPPRCSARPQLLSGHPSTPSNSCAHPALRWKMWAGVPHQKSWTSCIAIC